MVSLDKLAPNKSENFLWIILYPELFRYITLNTKIQSHQDSFSSFFVSSRLGCEMEFSGDSLIRFKQIYFTSFIQKNPVSSV